ncbi:MAG: hypothetical protein OSB67_01230 [Alphaproteobacteria bacterium]|nr:hypothetical protein [Alphaproteobacteria bacterium]
MKRLLGEALAPRGRIGLVTGFGLLVISVGAVLLPLLDYWFSGRTHPNAIGGLLPWNDAAGYYGCALSLLDGEGLSAFCQRRPAYSLYLAGLLRLAGSELQLALLLQGLMNAGAIFAVAVATARRWGTGPSIIAILILAAFAATMSIATLTENIGFVLGACGLVLFVIGAEKRSVAFLIMGAFILTFALNARAGAFLVIPLLVLWPFFSKTQTQGERWRFGILILVASAAGFVPGSVIVKLLGGIPSEAHSNLSYTLYGLVAGGERWIYALEKLPGASAEEIYRASWAIFRENPLLLIAGLFQGFLEYLQRLLTYIPWIPARIVLAACWLWGLGALVYRRRGDGELVLLLVMLGVVLSSPILSIDGGNRVYAATIAVDGFVVALGLASLMAGRAMLWGGVVVLLLVLSEVILPGDLRGWGGAMVIAGLVAVIGQRKPGKPRQAAIPWERSERVIVLSVLLVAVILLSAAPFWTKSGLPENRARATASFCAGGDHVVARLGRNSPVLRIVDAGKAEMWPVAASVESFRSNLHPLTHLYEELRSLQSGQAIVFAHNQATLSVDTGRNSFLVGDAALIPLDGGTYVLCVTDGESPPLMDSRRIVSVHSLTGS